jgi:hypothetical protein
VDADIMVEDEIIEVGIDQDGKLYVRPTSQRFPYIYRAAMEVGWDPVRGALFSPKPQEWSHLDWFRQILAAIADEYGVCLRICAAMRPPGHGLMCNPRRMLEDCARRGPRWPSGEQVFR